MCLLITSCHDIRSTQKNGKKWEENESNMRTSLDMSNGLIANYDLVGKSLTEIKELLGKPEKECNNVDCRIEYIAYK